MLSAVVESEAIDGIETDDGNNGGDDVTEHPFCPVRVYRSGRLAERFVGTASGVCRYRF